MSLTNRSEWTISHAGLGVPSLRQMSDRVHEVSFAEPHSPIDKQGVVGAPEVLRDLQCRRFCQLIAFAFDEGAETKIRIQARTDGTSPSARRRPARRICAGRRWRARSHFHRDDRRVAGIFGGAAARRFWAGD